MSISPDFFVDFSPGWKNKQDHNVITRIKLCLIWSFWSHNRYISFLRIFPSETQGFFHNVFSPSTVMFLHADTQSTSSLSFTSPYLVSPGPSYHILTCVWSPIHFSIVQGCIWSSSSSHYQDSSYNLNLQHNSSSYRERFSIHHCC